jgi:hypothetical protein
LLHSLSPGPCLALQVCRCPFCCGQGLPPPASPAAQQNKQLLAAAANHACIWAPPTRRRFGSGYLGDCERLLSRLVKQLK